jgi:hypothetical protein
MKHSAAIFSFLSISMLPALAHAQEFSYTYVDVALVNTEIDLGSINIDGDGLAVTGAFKLDERFFAVASYTDQDYDFSFSGSVFSIGVGYHADLGNNFDFVADLSYVDADVITSFGSNGENGFDIGAGIRTRLARKFELEARLGYIDVAGSDTVLGVKGRYYFSDGFAVIGGITDNDDSLGWSVGVRAEFGKR